MSEQRAEYRRSHREQSSACERAWRLAHPDKEAARRAAYRPKQSELNVAWKLAHPDAVRAQGVAYRARHPEQIRAKNSAYKAAKRATVVGDRVAIVAVYRQARENKRVACYLCGKLIPLGERHVDHIVPLSKGGVHAAGNMAIACATCNLKKGSKLPQEVGVLL